MTEPTQPQHVRDVRVLLDMLPERLAPLIAGLSDVDIDAWQDRERRARRRAQKDLLGIPPDFVSSYATAMSRAAIAATFAEFLEEVRVLRQKGANQALLY